MVDPVGLPGFAAVGREGLFGLWVVGVDGPDAMGKKAEFGAMKDAESRGVVCESRAAGV